MSTASSSYGNTFPDTLFSPNLFGSTTSKQNQSTLFDQDSYDQVAQSLRKELREEDVEMEDASGWPLSWESEVEADLRDAQGKSDHLQQSDDDVQYLGTRKATQQRPVFYLALDTNIFVSHLNIVRSLYDALSKQTQSRESALLEVKLLVPNTVVHELDRQKNRWNESSSSPFVTGAPHTTSHPIERQRRSLALSRHANSAQHSASVLDQRTSTQSLAVAARAAIEWLLQVRQVQRREQQAGQKVAARVMIFQKKGEVFDRGIIVKADDRILDCCEYYQNQCAKTDNASKNKVVLWTDDKNLSLQAEIHEVPCIGNRYYSVQQVIDSVRHGGASVENRLVVKHEVGAMLPISLPSSLPKRPAWIGSDPSSTLSQRPSSNISPTLITKKPLLISPTLKKSLAVTHTSNQQLHRKARDRALDSSVWAEPAKLKKQNASSSVSSTTSRAQDATLSISIAVNISTTPASSSRPVPATTTAPRLAEAVDIINNHSATPNCISIALGHIIAFPLFDLLLQHVGKGEPTVLRQFIGTKDPGPGHWNAKDCLDLMTRAWGFGLHWTYAKAATEATPSICPYTVHEGLVWLHGFFNHYATEDRPYQQIVTTQPAMQIDWRKAVQAISLVFVRHTPEWWLDADLVRTINMLHFAFLVDVTTSVGTKLSISEAASNEMDPITQCGQSVLYLLRTHARTLATVPSATSTFSTARTDRYQRVHDAFATLLHLARQKTTQTAFHAVSAPWLRLYVDATLGLVITFVLTAFDSLQCDSNGAKESHERACAWTRWVGMLDRAIIVAGAIGDGREEAVNKLIELVQENFAPPEWYKGVRVLAESENRSFKQGNGRKRRRSSDIDIPHCSRPNQQLPRFAYRQIPTYTSPPSISTYLRTPDLLNRPFVIKGYATSSSSDSTSDTSSAIPCPALERWQSAAYLLHLTGPGRLVPVEVGSSYTSPEWGQRVVPWEAFLEAVGYGMGSVLDVHPPTSSNDNSSPSDIDDDDAENDNDGTISPNEPTYLAQHPLITHFPALAHDLGAALSPEYIFSAPPPPEWFEEYVPPGCGEGVVRNVWVGSGGRKAKAEDKDAGNGLVESGEDGEEVVGPVVSPAHTVLGRKRVWVAPPSVSPEHMYAFSDASAEDPEDGKDLKVGKHGLDGKMEGFSGEGGNDGAGSTMVNTEQRPDDRTTSSSSRAPSPSSSIAESATEAGLLTSYMTNTSRVPIFTSSSSFPNNDSLTSNSTSVTDTSAAVRAQYPAFYKHAWPHSMEIVLEPGDLMVMPPKWWHAMRSEGEGVVWSVSMWY
ncbi:hypothetical protein QFC22_005756 [Naganishia vaughanmartiniae]|uniref:Uncharacterized protein n=1 Tax=Naganishia vaughanmartiniae TaxID=1424756 RepID=A0ACC2WT14_9TREE|nr:hypothetical protein QFC22_005756 [Naganishia vaughanmartiniae]